MITTIEQHNIIFDIDARQSGKTTRMIDYVTNVVMNDDRIGDIYILSPNQNMSNLIRQRMNHISIPDTRNIHIVSVSRFDEFNMIMNRNDFCVFDESDFMDNIYLRANSYYATTPSSGITERMRDSLLSDDFTIINDILSAWVDYIDIDTRHMEHIISSDTGMPVFYNNETIRQLFNDVSEEIGQENDDEQLDDPYLYRIGVIDE